ncbi:hypothetical protein DPMN_116685 [Dreissena polymorpha]|uniref:Uncharacterized protein n=1 Tax=Dreissena polymorpha TaxID=45954 RepID=A0A9D4KP45_DREPO|nr:hypothetical protein DPMN_116685 [Dreissena polymorpha]
MPMDAEYSTKHQNSLEIKKRCQAQSINGTNLRTKFHEDRKMNVASRVKNAPPPGSHFHEDRTVNVASRVKNAPPLGRQFVQANIIVFELIQDIIETNLLTKFHEYWTINVASRVLTRKNVTIFELIQNIIATVISFAGNNHYV